MQEPKHKNNEIIPVSSILGDSFYIPSYQRGYRWTRSQVEDLLEDIKEFLQNKNDGDFYCLQPLVVREDAAENRYRVIDGQQRLTTIWLILLCINQNERSPFEIKYERPTRLGLIEDFTLDESDKIELKKIEDNEKWNDYVNEKWQLFGQKEGKQDVELYHLFAAKLFILNWLNENDFPEDFTDSIRFIWHNVADASKELSTFKNLNSGKIPLTNAELIKAIFLGSFGSVDTEGKLRQNLLAEEFDSVERKLREDDFWYFLNSDSKPTSCIGFIFELMQNLDGNNRNGKQEYSTYFYFRDKIGEDMGSNKSDKVTKAMKIWERVMQIFHIFEGWYADPEIYNLIGYLRAIKRKTSEIFKKYEELGTKSQFRDYLKSQCMKSIDWEKEMDDKFLEKFRYDNNKEKTNRLLILLNIAMLGNQVVGDQNKKKEITKFSFKDFHNCNWHIEHISPNNAAYKESLREIVGEPLPKIDAALKGEGVLSNEQKEATDPYVAVFDESIMSLPNLTLLSSHINESIGRKFFAQKRDIVISKQTEGYYVPPCTLMVFTKSFIDKTKLQIETKSEVSKLDFWSDIDREEYKKKITNILTGYFGKKPNEKGAPAECAKRIECEHPYFIDLKAEEHKSTQVENGDVSLPIMTYSQLMGDYDYVVIPKIQRDYAQGRSKDEDGRAEQVRIDILKDIFECKHGHKLDFQIVFGTIEERLSVESRNYKTFIPIDGQQRLTTLFLLSLYRDKRWEKQKDMEPKFIYETRRAATEFCEAVTINEWGDFPNIKPGKAITESVWFMDYWKQDPTVSSMLRMLDAIHRKSSDKIEDFPDLENIEFSFFDLGNNNISENIYLKMNSRGKPLSSFENLKAEIENKFLSKLPEGWKKNIDSLWQDSFWSSENPTRLPDMGMLRFFANYLLVRLCEIRNFEFNGPLDKEIKEYEKENEDDKYADLITDLKLIKGLEQISHIKNGDFVTTSFFIKAFERVGFDGLYEILNFKANNDWQAKVKPNWGWNKEEWRSVLDSSYTRRAILYAVMKNVAASEEALSEWMRFAWNMAENTVNSFESFNSCCSLFKQLYEKGGSNILTTLVSEEADNFSQTDQYKEEIEKARKKDTNLFDLIKEVEKYSFFRGAIRPLFSVSDDKWNKFEEKHSHLSELLPSKKEHRAKMVRLLNYIPDEEIVKVFNGGNKLNFSDDNLRTLFLKKENRHFIERYLLGEPTEKPTLLQSQLMKFAEQFFKENNDSYYIRTDWGKCVVLTNYSMRSGYYILKSYVLNDSLHEHILEILRRLVHILNPGIEMYFDYDGFHFCYYHENKTIGLLGNEWPTKFLNHRDREAYSRPLTKEDNEDSIKKILDDIVEYANEQRISYYKYFKNIFNNYDIEPETYGCNGEKDEPLSSIEHVRANRYKWLTIAFRPKEKQYIVAVTIRKDLSMEVGLRRLPCDNKKQNDKIEFPVNDANRYKTDNDWWYYVHSETYNEITTIQTMLEQILKVKEIVKE